MSESYNEGNRIVLGTIGTMACLAFSYGLRAGDSEIFRTAGQLKRTATPPAAS